jgi:hypothetical protein
MTLFIARKMRLCLGLTLLASFMAVGQEQANIASPVLPSGGGSVLALAQWRVAGKLGRLLCQVSQQSANADRSPIRILSIYREEGAKLPKVFNFETPDSLLNMYALGDYNSRLFTTWIGGSAYHLRVWAFVDGQVKQVLDEGAKIAPEFLYDDQGRESVLITDPAMENGKWTATNGTTTVFKWDGQGYEKIGTVPWLKRLRCLSKESCASLK